jgi:hypothetical protein
MRATDDQINQYHDSVLAARLGVFQRNRKGHHMSKAEILENLVEPICVADTFVTDLVRIESLGPCARLTFATRQIGVGYRAGESKVEYIVTQKLIVPSDTLALWATQIAQWWPNEKGELARLSETGKSLQ